MNWSWSLEQLGKGARQLIVKADNQLSAERCYVINNN